MVLANLNSEHELREVVKRDGRKVAFDEDKIVEAIKKAFQACGDYRSYNYYRMLSSEVLMKVYSCGLNVPSVEQIQDIVEEVLIQYNHPRVAKAYIIYRAERSRIREMNTKLMKVYEDITFKSASECDIKRENANVNGDTAMGTMLKYGSEGAKQFFEMFVLDPVHSKAHKDGDIHIHDLDFFAMTTTCCQIDLIKLFKDGFGTGHGTLREPQDIISYSALACIAIQSNQNDQHGGQSIPNFDYSLAVGVGKTFMKQYIRNMGLAFDLLLGKQDMLDTIKAVNERLSDNGIPLRLNENGEYRKAEAELLITEGFELADVSRCQDFAIRNAEKATDRMTFQAMEALVHNLNTMHSRAGAQTPFSSINYGMDTSPEGRMVIKNILLALQAGLGNGETPIFPIHIFRVKDGVNLNEGEPNYDLFQLACKVSAKRLFPNFSFVDAPYNLKYYVPGRPETEIAYMGCRTRVIGNVYDRNNEITYGRGNLSFTSINLPRLGIKARKDLDVFYKELDDIIALTISQMMERFRIQCTKKVKNYPFLMGEGIWLGSDGLDMEDSVAEILKHGTLSLGFIGLAECLVALTGSHHGESPEAQKLGLEIVRHMRKLLDDYSEQYKMNITLLATPAEGLSGRFVDIDKKLYGEIEGVTDREYYTNSFHVPVYYKISAFEKINIEAPYHEPTNAGHITYVELDGDMTKNEKAFEAIIRHMQKSGVGYGSVNHPVDRDPVCGFTGIIGDTCPVCGRNEGGVPFERIRRVTGYLGGTSRFNNAKLAELRDRLKHNVEI